MNERLSQVRELLEKELMVQAAQAVADLHPADVAHLIEELPEDDKRKLFGVLDAALAAEVVVELSDESREQVLEGIQTRRLVDIVDDMPSDEATDIIADLPREQAQEVLAGIDWEDSAEVRTLLKYDEDTAGGIMQLELVSVRADQSVAQAIDAIRIMRDEVEDVHNVYVVDSEKRVVGRLPLDKLILADPDTPVNRVMEDCPLVVQAEEDQEDVAHKFRRYDVVSAPVVDARGRLVGRITIDDVMEILDEEAEEDLLRMVGSSSEYDMLYTDKIFKISRLRLPWLLTNLIGGLFTGWLLWKFKVTLTDAIFLVTFIPVITAMGGNVGIQSSTLMVRGFAVGRVTFGNIWRILFREMRVALVMGVACGIAVGLVAHFWHHNSTLGFVVGLAMICSISAASLMGTLAPAAFKKLGVDPAISAGPFVTTANDIVGILIYFTIATIFYRQLVT